MNAYPGTPVKTSKLAEDLNVGDKFEYAEFWLEMVTALEPGIVVTELFRYDGIRINRPPTRYHHCYWNAMALDGQMPLLVQS